MTISTISSRLKAAHSGGWTSTTTWLLSTLTPCNHDTCLPVSCNIAEKTSDGAFKNVGTRNEDKKNHLWWHKLSKDYQTNNSGGKVNSNSLQQPMESSSEYALPEDSASKPDIARSRTSFEASNHDIPRSRTSVEAETVSQYLKSIKVQNEEIEGLGNSRGSRLPKS